MHSIPFLTSLPNTDPNYGLNPYLTKDKRQIELDKSALEAQQIRCQRETERLENKSEIVRCERVRLRRLMSDGQKVLHKALEDQTQAINLTTQVF